MHRRSFLNAAGFAAAGTVLGAGTPATAVRKATYQSSSTSRRLRVLMLGGTGFLGPTIVETLLDRGHDVTLFNRGVTNPHLFTYLEKLRGDREEENGGPDLGALRGRDWDVVIDTWQKGPKCVEDTARLLSGHARIYYYISSISVYHNTAFRQLGTTETAQLSDIEGHPINRKPDEQSYFLRKTLAEKVLAENFEGEVGILRSHGIRGARINTPESEHYWPVKIWRGGDVLAPEDGQTWGQFTDTVSLCRFLAHCAENDLAGPYNVLSSPFRLKEFFDAIQNVSHRKANLIWTPREKLAEFDIEPYRDLPMWRPEPVGFYRFSSDKAVQVGFRHRSLEACAASMLHGYIERHPEDDFVFGRRGQITDEKEAEVLTALGR
ncbi:MAG: NAD-dependent epimerase/dehydratase family protein [Pseudomonadota bacterium]